MSKELIEQLAKEHCFGVNHYNQFGLGNFQAQFTFTLDQLEAFAKAYAQTQGQSINEPAWDKTLYEFVNCSICTGHGCMKCGSMGGFYKIATFPAAPIESGVKG